MLHASCLASSYRMHSIQNRLEARRQDILDLRSSACPARGQELKKSSLQDFFKRTFALLCACCLASSYKMHFIQNRLEACWQDILDLRSSACPARGQELKRAHCKTLIEGLLHCLGLAALKALIKCILFKIAQRLTDKTSWILEAPLARQGGRSLKRAHCKTLIKGLLLCLVLAALQALIKCILFKIAHLLHL